jgi:16S rRNA G966 N2-methylase RsmD
MIGFNEKGNATFSTAVGKWMGLGPYYAMFPMKFAFDVVQRYSSVGDHILDPFAGRASSIYAAAALDRKGVGIEINPAGWIHGHVKLCPAPQKAVLKRTNAIGKLASSVLANTLDNMPEFFRLCYTDRVLSFLITARNELNWKRNKADATLMAIILVYLHGKKSQSLSNQMRQSKAMSQEYSIRWWHENDSRPPEIDPIEFLTTKIEWRYEKGRNQFTDSKVVLGDSIKYLKSLQNKVANNSLQKFDLLFTSPPYHDLTNYYYDQWLRLWMLGGDDVPILANKGKWQKRFASKVKYRQLLESVFQQSARLMSPRAAIYVRTDAREFTFNTTYEVLIEAFPKKEITILEQPISKPSQTSLFGDKSKKPGEKDIILR